MAEVTLLHLINYLDDDEEERDSPIEFVTTTDHNEDAYWSSDYDFDFFIPDRSPRHRNSIPRRPSFVFDHFYGEEDDGVNPESATDLPGRENQNNFVIDLLNQRVEQSQRRSTEHLVLDPEVDPVLDLNFGVIEGNEEMGSTQLDRDIGLGFVEEPSSPDERSDLVGENVNRERRHGTGLRVVEIGSDSDSDSDFNLDGINLNAADDTRLQAVDIVSDSVLDLNLEGINFGADDIQDASGDENDDQSLALCWDSFQIEDPQDVITEFDWEEVVQEAVDETEVLNTLNHGSLTGHEDGLNSVGHVVEWQEVVVRMNGYLDTEDDDEVLNEFSFDDTDLDEYNYTSDYDMFFGHFGESDIPMLGSPPAAKDVVKNLPVIVLSKDDVEKTNAVCAVCRDEMEAGEAIRQLSCSHNFHGDCIMPWLGIRNTCPVCRFELPTDDPEYEKRKDARANQIH